MLKSIKVTAPLRICNRPFIVAPMRGHSTLNSAAIFFTSSAWLVDTRIRDGSLVEQQELRPLSTLDFDLCADPNRTAAEAASASRHRQAAITQIVRRLHDVRRAISRIAACTRFS